MTKDMTNGSPMRLILGFAFDLFFIINLKMGVAGAAWATVIAQVVAGVGCLLFMIWKFEILHIRREEWKPDGHMMMVLCGMGVPMGLQYSITAIGSVILQSATNMLGSAAVAAVTAVFWRAPLTHLVPPWQPTGDKMWVQVN